MILMEDYEDDETKEKATVVAEQIVVEDLDVPAFSTWTMNLTINPLTIRNKTATTKKRMKRS